MRLEDKDTLGGESVRQALECERELLPRGTALVVFVVERKRARRK